MRRIVLSEAVLGFFNALAAFSTKPGSDFCLLAN
jgi:hypothetical protein